MRERQVQPSIAKVTQTLSTDWALCAQSVYKTYIDVVHVAKNDTVKMFTTAGGSAAGDAQRAAASIFDSGDLGREEIEAKEAAMVVRAAKCPAMFMRARPDVVTQLSHTNPHARTPALLAAFFGASPATEAYHPDGRSRCLRCPGHETEP